jgi:hypothetical protein
MVSSFAVSVVLLVLSKNGLALSTHKALLVTVAVTTVSWVLTAFLGPETDRAILTSFYEKVRPFGPGWTRVREAAGIPRSASTSARDNIPLALLGWFAGCTAIWSALFTVGSFLYGRLPQAFFLLAVFVVSGLGLLYVGQRLWSDTGEEAP